MCKGMGHAVDVASFHLCKKMDIDAHYAFRFPSQKITNRILRKAIRAWSLLLPFEPVSEFLNDRRWGFSNVLVRLQHNQYDAVIVHDAWLLPFVFKMKGQAKVIFDAREYYPGEMEGNLLWRILDRPEKVRVCRRYMPQCDQVMTVSPGIVTRYKEDIGVESLLVRSAPKFYDAEPQIVQNNIVRMVHHGGANRDRKLENMIDMFSMLDNRFTLDFYLTGSPSYKKELQKRAVGQDRIRFLDPVPFNQILPMLQNYDIGLYLLEPTGFNTEYSLPNKFFEFIQARLMLAIGPSPDMASLLREYDCGIVSDDFKPETMARALNALTADFIMQKKRASDRAARDLCFEEEGKKIVSILNSVGIH
ncbi:capsular polysaccharide synthesis enzyme Cap5I [Micavibrio aeruginosavorus EPB]|uniref:Capsular polysaccharide synthesis enzyme Cap5I n=1 Tax=Micavibrio aeruginosavorus EPB TaxID=349215 RepID=M4VH32_9BACT|nr:capsular polysaccharide synthesis enzyme Cap5I [Micavibrio aeruginosavorus EPB]